MVGFGARFCSNSFVIGLWNVSPVSGALSTSNGFILDNVDGTREWQLTLLMRGKPTEPKNYRTHEIKGL